MLYFKYPENSLKKINCFFCFFYTKMMWMFKHTCKLRHWLWSHWFIFISRCPNFIIFAIFKCFIIVVYPDYVVVFPSDLYCLVSHDIIYLTLSSSITIRKWYGQPCALGSYFEMINQIMFQWFHLIWFNLILVFNATFSNISAISWRSVLVVEEAAVHRENHRPRASNW